MVELATAVLPYTDEILASDLAESGMELTICAIASERESRWS